MKTPKPPLRSMVSACAVMLLTVALSVSSCTSAPSTASRTRSQHALTAAGWALWNLEGLLHQTSRHNNQRFGPCTKASTSGQPINFAASPSCSPLAEYDPYFYNFRGDRHTAFHITDVRWKGDAFAGNYPVPVLYNGYLIACDKSDKKLLGEFSDSANWSLHCFATPYVRLHQRR